MPITLYSKSNNKENEKKRKQLLEQAQQQNEDLQNEERKRISNIIQSNETNRNNRLNIARNANNNINNRIQDNKSKINDIVSQRKEIVDNNKNNRKNFKQIEEINNALQNRNFQNRQPQNIMLNDITKTKSTNIQNIGLREYSKNNGIDLGKGAQNLWLSLQNGIIDFNNNSGRQIVEGMPANNVINNQLDFFSKSYAKTNGISEEQAKKILQSQNKLLTPAKYTPKFMEKKHSNQKKINENAETSSNAVTKYINGNIAPAIGQMLPSFIPGVGPMYMAGSATGSYYDEGKERGMSDEEAKAYSAKMGMAETLSEMIPVSKIINTTKSAAKQGIKTTLKDIATAGIENAVQEGIMEPTSEFMAGEKYANWDNIGGRIASSALAGGLVGGVLAGTGAGIGSTQKIFNNSKIRDTRIENKAQKLQEQQITQDNNKVAPNENMEQIQENKNEIANVQNSLYNNSNESESDINGETEITTRNRQNDYRRVQRLFESYRAGETNKDSSNQTVTGQTQSKQDQAKLGLIDFAEKYRKTQLNENEQKLEKIIKNLGGNLIVYDYGTDNLFPGLTKDNNVYVDNSCNEKIENIVYHEAIHLARKNNNPIYINEIQPVVNKMAGEFDYSDLVYEKAISNPEDYTINDLTSIEKRKALAEEIIADYGAVLNGDLDSDVELPSEYRKIIDNAFNKIFNNQELEIANSIDNKKNILYNRTNESESGINANNMEGTVYKNASEEQSQKANSTENNREQSKYNSTIQQEYEQQRKTIGNAFEDVLSNQYGFDKETSQSIINEISNKFNKDKTTVDDIFKAFDNHREIVIEIDNIDQALISKIRSHIRNAKLNVSSIKKNITDYNDFRKHNFGKLKLSNTGLDIDVFYQELCEMYPGYFDSDITNENDQLSVISDFMNSEELLNTNNESYYLTDDDLNEIVNNMFNEFSELKNVYKEELEKSSSINLPKNNDLNLENTFPKRRVEVVKEITNKKEKEANLLDKMNSDKLTFKQQYGLLNQKIVNKGYYIDKLADKTGNQELKYKYDRMLGASSEGQYEIEYAQTNNEGKAIGKSINEIWKPVEDADLVSEFSYYLLHKLNIERYKRKKPVFGEDITSEISESVSKNYEKLYPEFKNWSNDVNTFNKNQLQSMVDAGLTSEETQKFLDDTYSNYVTISRDIDKSNNILPTKGKITGTNNPIKKAIGGNSDIQPLKDTMAKQAIAVKQAIRRNEVGLELMKILKNHENAENVDVNNIVSVDSKGNGKFIVFDKGQAKSLKIDKGLYESLKTSQKSDLENTLPLKGVQKLSQIQRSLLTVDNPLFVITNFAKDLQDGIFNSKYSSKFLPNYGRALKEITTKGKFYKQYTANGGESNTYFDYNKGVKKAPTKVGKFVEKIRNINEVVEMAPRLAEFISTIEDGKSINEAMYNAAEVTTNFKRGGELTKIINRNGANFLNASVQGLSKQVRNIIGANGLKGYVNLLAKVTILGIAPSVINHLLFFDDEEYQKLPDYVKDTYYLFKTKDGFVRIPKGRALSIFGSSAVRTLRYAQGDKEAFKDLFKTFGNQMAPNNPFTSNIFSPVGQVLANKTWFDGDLVPTRLKNELAKNQYDESTDSLSKEIGQLFNVSPIKVNYLLDQYSGGIGDVILPYLTPQARSNPLTSKFTIDSVLKNKNISSFYETIDEQTKLANDVEPSDENILKSKYLNSIQSDISALYKEKRETQLSDLKNDVKKEEVRKIQQQINDLAENALKNYNKVSKGSNYAQIGDKKYYKNNENKWTALTKDEELKNRNISIKTYADYKNKTYKLKEKDKIKQVLSSNYNDIEKIALYENYLQGNDNDVYNIMKKTNIKIKDWLDYSMQNFSADKEDDGTINGKSISGSKKAKFYDYIANSNFNYGQRLLLTGMNYKLQSDERDALADYINSLNLSQNETQSIYKKLVGATIYKNGEIYY